MSSRFSEITNAKWCKICSVNILDGDEHPNLDAHYEAEKAEFEAAQNEAVLSKKMQATSSLIPVSSNDMLKHIAQPASPETLCGRPIADKYRPSTTDLVCDVCADLASAANFLATSKAMLENIKELEDQNNSTQTITADNNFNVTAVNYTRDGYKIDDDGFTVITADQSDDFVPFSPFTYERTVVASEFDEVDFDRETDDGIVYMGMFDEPIQFTAHWLEEDTEEPLFLPNDEF